MLQLFAWKVGTVGSQWHVLHFGKPLCGTPVPDRPIYTITKDARPSDWARTCLKCRETAVRKAAEEKPADRGEAVDGPNGSTGKTAPVALEDTAPVRTGQTV